MDFIAYSYLNHFKRVRGQNVNARKPRQKNTNKKK